MQSQRFDHSLDNQNDVQAKILVVDDEPFNLLVIEGMLQRLKQPFEVALSGKDAFEKIKPRVEAIKRGEHSE